MGSPIEFDTENEWAEPYRAAEYQNFLASLQTDDIGMHIITMNLRNTFI